MTHKGDEEFPILVTGLFKIFFSLKLLFSDLHTHTHTPSSPAGGIITAKWMATLNAWLLHPVQCHFKYSSGGGRLLTFEVASQSCIIMELREFYRVLSVEV